jgi:hypothetical protein
MRHVAAFGIALGLVAAMSHAADVPVAGTRVQIRAHGTREKLTFTSKDAAWTLPAPPNAGTPGSLLIDIRSPAHPTPVYLSVPQWAGNPGWTVSFDGERRATPLPLEESVGAR